MNKHMKYDDYGEVINGEETYNSIVEFLEKESRCLIGWTDQNGTHLDLLFVNRAPTFGTIQRGIRSSDLFVAIMSRGVFGFEINDADTHAGYYNEKLGGGLGSTSEALSELINEVRKRLC